MIEKLIVENRTELNMAKVMEYIIAVLNLGRISNNDKNYCYVTTFGGIVVACFKNKRSDRFVVYQERKEDRR